MMLQPPVSLRAVILDFDGVVGDTMTENFRAWEQAFSHYGVTITTSDYYPLEGMGPRGVAEALCRLYGAPTSLAPAIAEDKERLYLSINTFRMFPEIPMLLRVLLNLNAPLALVTGASRKRLRSSLPADIQSAFACIVTSDDVTATKPAPEPYQKALDILGISATHSVAVENAPLGIASAKGAGLFCVALCTTLPPEALRAADLIVQTHADLLPFFLQYAGATTRGMS
jgi:beta-phosphoglucomutase